MIRSLVLLLLLGSVAHGESPIGVSATVDVILPGDELEAIPLEDRKAPIVLRIEESEATANGFRYRMVYFGLEAGEYDLRKFLRWADPKNKSEIPDRPAWHVKVTSVLPPGQVLPHELDPKAEVQVGGYRKLLWLLGSIWVAGLILILFWPRKKKDTGAVPEAKQTLADKLRPLVQKGMQSELSAAEQAQLERYLMAFWRKKLNLERTDPMGAIQQLKAHPEAGQLLRTLENWLHAPPASRSNLSVEELLKPYQSVTTESLEGTP